VSGTAGWISLALTLWSTRFVTSFKIDSGLALDARRKVFSPVVVPRHLGKPCGLAVGDSIVGDRSRSDLVSRIHRQAQESNRPFPSSRGEQFATRREEDRGHFVPLPIDDGSYSACGHVE
jgi:hypothetical protein